MLQWPVPDPAMSNTPGHMSFFELLEALQQPGCALCRLVAGGTRRRLEALLYESVNDVGFRELWRKTRGYCHRHSWMLADTGHTLGLAILYEALIEHWGERLLEAAPARPCPVCSDEDRAGRDHLDTLVKGWDEPRLAEAWAASDGLCGPHVRLAGRLARPASVRDAIAAHSAKRLCEMTSDLRALIESFDYRHEPARDERTRTAWHRAMEKIIGHRDLPEPHADS